MKCKYLENQITVRSDGQYRLCCVSVEPDNKENINTHSPEQWKNSKTHTEIRDILDRGEWPAACVKCRLQEEAGVESKRTKAKFFGPGISHLDLRLGNSCNLKCISCWNMSSSSIAEEEQEMVKNSIACPVQHGPIRFQQRRSGRRIRRPVERIRRRIRRRGLPRRRQFESGLESQGRRFVEQCQE